MMLNDLLERKESFLDEKMLFHNSRKIDVFPTHDFRPKLFSLKRTKMMFDDVLDRKEGLPKYKNVTLP